MYKHKQPIGLNQHGAVNGILISLIVSVLLLVSALAFGVWAFNGRSLYKNHSDQLVATAVIAAKQQEDRTDAILYAQEAKNPLRTYNGPSTYGSLVVQYPKTWSGYVDDSGTGQALIDAYFDPGQVPSITDQNSVFSLRFQVIANSYSQELQNFQGQEQSGLTTAVAYALPKVPKVVGVELTGMLNGTETGTMVVLPLRDKTLEIWTDGTQYINDFNTNILPNFSFSP
jgi:type II secretory pathway pseudopilin PulG